MKTVASLGEFGLIKEIQRILKNSKPDVLAGIGDDAAVIAATSRPLVITTDAMVEDVHFKQSWSTPADTAYKALAGNISDLAASGADPAHGLVTLGLPADTPAEWVLEFYHTLANCCKAWNIAIIGGDTVRAEKIFISITLWGYQITDQPLLYSTANIDDWICVTGTLGDAAAGLDFFSFGQVNEDDDTLFLTECFLRPMPRILEMKSLLSIVLPGSMTDISDGLSRDLPKLCQASGVGAEIDSAALPISSVLQRWAGEDAVRYALQGGEDYELLFTLPKKKAENLFNVWDPSTCPITKIGEIKPLEYGIQVKGWSRELTAGFDHFKNMG